MRIMRICTSQYVRWHQFQPPDTCAFLFFQACLGSSSGYFENVCVDTAKSVLLGWGEGRGFLSSTQSPRANRLASNHIRPPAPASALRHQQCIGSPLAGGEYTSFVVTLALPWKNLFTETNVGQRSIPVLIDDGNFSTRYPT